MPDREALRAQYRATRCFLAAGGAWQPLAFLPAERTGVVITAWNPGSRALTPAVNASRDAALARELAARDLAPLRARGTSPDDAWHEDGWLIAHERARTAALLACWGQLAAYLFDARGRRVLWADGEEELL